MFACTSVFNDHETTLLFVLKVQVSLRITEILVFGISADFENYRKVGVMNTALYESTN